MTPIEAYTLLRAHALTLPETHEDFPWGDRVVKVKAKVFLFLAGAPDPDVVGFSVKLPASGPQVLEAGRGTPTAYGLGRSGWVTVRLREGIDGEELVRWVEESYRAVAPKRLGARVPAR